jgi:hypothetical protein
MTSNYLRMPLAEWVYRMRVAGVAREAVGIAFTAALFDISSNAELAEMSGHNAGSRTLDKHKGDLVKGGWVLIPPCRGGRGIGVKVIPAVAETPVEFTDVSARNPSKICSTLAKITSANFAPHRITTPAEVADVHARAPAEGINNIYNKNNNLLHSPLPTSVEQEAAREGETEIAPGLFVNCETIRHRDFTINLKGIAMQLCGIVPEDTIKSIATGHALSWASIIASGRRVQDVPPNHPDNWIRASIRKQLNEDAVTDVRKKRAAGPAAGSKRMSLDELSDNVEAVFDRQSPQSKKPARLTHER